MTVIETLSYDIRTGTSTAFDSNQTHASFLRKYHIQDLHYLTEYIDYNPYLTFAFYIGIKLATLGNAYGNIVPVIMFNYLTDMFTTYTSSLVTSIQKSFQQKSVIQWEFFHNEFLKLKKVTEEVSRFVSLLIVSSYGISLTMAILAIFENLEMNRRAEIDPRSSTANYETMAYAHLSLVYFSLRLFLLTYFAAEVNHHSSRKVLQVIDSHPGIPCSWSVSFRHRCRCILQINHINAV
ncbi:unnamed protein product [Orchesella dallaii]|uniref:ABC transmembrane type-1 domain-containing protein n=1 Tax=Orchesella dallaii TaxID=48710 RepID=A0ABP1Q0R1_9HEXA